MRGYRRKRKTATGTIVLCAITLLVAITITINFVSVTVNANLKMSVFAEKECYFSPDSIQVYTALTTTLLVGLKPVKP